MPRYSCLSQTFVIWKHCLFRIKWILLVRWGLMTNLGLSSRTRLTSIAQTFLSWWYIWRDLRFCRRRKLSFPSKFTIFPARHLNSLKETWKNWIRRLIRIYYESELMRICVESSKSTVWLSLENCREVFQIYQDLYVSTSYEWSKLIRINKVHSWTFKNEGNYCFS